MPRFWAGVDAGKTHHHCVVIDEDGARLLSRKVANTEDEILALLADVTGLADAGELVWATDLNQGGAALLIAVLAANGQPLLYIPGRTVHHAAAAYRGDGKTDAKDAAIIADQARMRRDLTPVRATDDIAVELRMLAAHRADLVADRTRAINRLRATLLEYFPALEAAFDYARRKARWPCSPSTRHPNSFATPEWPASPRSSARQAPGNPSRSLRSPSTPPTPSTPSSPGKTPPR